MPEMTKVAMSAAFQSLDEPTKERIERAEAVYMCIFQASHVEVYDKVIRRGVDFPEDVLPDIRRSSSLGLSATVTRSNELEAFMATDASFAHTDGRRRGNNEFLRQDPISYIIEIIVKSLGLTAVDHHWVLVPCSSVCV